MKGKRSNFKALKHRFFNPTQFAFWATQEAENEFKVGCENVNLSFIDITKSHFELFKREKLSSKWNVST